VTEGKGKIYCISGLGVDHRAFDRISIQGFDLVPVPWIEPQKNESLTNYARRLFEATNPSDDFILMGVSFGGVIAQEWAKFQKPKKLILISTTHQNRSIKPILRIPGKLGLVYFLSPEIILLFSSVTSYFFGLKSKSDKEKLKIILHDTDSKFLRWAINSIFQWSSKMDSEAIWIHGKNDKIISPPSNSDFLTSGGHFTVYTEGGEISTYLRGILK